MGKINRVRVVLGGLVAGVIIDVVEYFLHGKLLADEWSSIMAAHNLSLGGAPEMVAYEIMGLLLGIVAVWTYAAIRPRFGAGIRTAIYAALLMWLAAYVLMDISPAITGMYSRAMTTVLLLVGLAEILVATIAGAWLYKEADV